MLNAGNSARILLATSTTLSSCRLLSFISHQNCAMNSVVISASGSHSATVIFLHGLGDTGHGWSSVFESMIRHPHIKYILPHAPTRPVTLNMGMRMPAWFDLFGLSVDSKEDDQGIEESNKIVHDLINKEIDAGISPDRIVLGGFSMGGALALYSAFTFDKSLAGVVALSSFLIQRQKIPGSHTANREVAIFQGHGNEDPLCDLSVGQATGLAIKSFNPNHQLKVYAGLGHSSSDEELRDVKAFLMKQLPVK